MSSNSKLQVQKYKDSINEHYLLLDSQLIDIVLQIQTTV